MNDTINADRKIWVFVSYVYRNKDMEIMPAQLEMNCRDFFQKCEPKTKTFWITT